MSLDNNDNEQNPWWAPPPSVATDARQLAGGSNPNYGYNPSTSMVGQTSANGDAAGLFSANPNSLAGGYSSPAAQLNANVFGTNEFNASAPYAGNAGNAGSTINQGVTSGSGDYAMGVNPFAPNAAGQGANVDPATGLPSSYGVAPSTLGNSSGPGSSFGSTQYGTPAPLPPGASNGLPSSGSSGKPANLSWEQRGYYDPSSFARGWEHVLSEQGLGGITDNPAARFAQQDSQRAYAQWVMDSALGKAPQDSTESVMRDYVNSRGSRQGMGSSTISDLQNAISGVENGTMSPTSPQYQAIANMIDLAWTNPQQLSTLLGNLMPRGVGSANMGQYLYRYGMQRQNASGNASPVNFLQAILSGMQ